MAAASPHLPVRADWLALRNEPALRPALPIIDAHHHLWNRPESRYLTEEFRNDLAGGHNIRASVYVQCRSFYRTTGEEVLRPVGEVEHVGSIAADTAASGGPEIGAGIVGGADLRLGDRVQPVLETMCIAARGRLRGIRNQTAWHADPAIRSSPVAAPPGLLQDDQWRRGAAVLPRFGLTLDIWVYQTQLSEAFALAAALPDLPVVLDHLGGPLLAGRDPDLAKAWRDDLRAFSRLPNTYLKLGGLGMRVAGYRFDQDEVPPSSEMLAAAWRSPILTAIEFFGPDRCMFESNFPVDKGMVGYTSLWNAFKRIADPFPADEQAALFHGTAARVYQISI